MKIKEIEQHFEQTVPKITLKKASEDIANGVSLINSDELVFNYDSLKGAIKSSDTIYFEENKIIFIEFKNGNIKSMDFRLKATEGLMIFLKHLKKVNPTLQICFPNNCLEIHYVYNDSRINPTKLEEFKKNIRLLNKEYSGVYSNLKLVKASEFKI